MLGTGMLGNAPLGWVTDPGAVTVRVWTVLHRADGAPLVDTPVTARRADAGGVAQRLVVVGATTAVTDAQGVATLELLPSYGDVYRITATDPASGALVLDVVALVPLYDAALRDIAQPNTGMHQWH